MMILKKGVELIGVIRVCYPIRLNPRMIPLGGKTRRLSVHHVYYQKKACCGWDGDLQGYYAMINLGTEGKPNMVRHNIDGDPNKFVVLTHSEHSATNFDKLKWIKVFEDLIQNQGGKCYFTKGEMPLYPQKLRKN